MKLVYLAGPISRGNPWENGAQADNAMLALMRAGVAVVNPMLTMWAGACREVLDAAPLSIRGDSHYLRPLATAYGPFTNVTHEEWLAMGKEILSRCDAVLRLPGASAGASIEVEHALSCWVPVFHDIGELIAYLEDDDDERGTVRRADDDDGAGNGRRVP